MRQKLRKVLFVLLALFALAGTVMLDYFLPEKTIAKVTGVEVKLSDKDGPVSKSNPLDGPATDVYYIYTEQDVADVRVYRNEDTRWGWPFYFKFDSSDVQARAKALEFEKQPALITSYGWRIAMFSVYPNAISVSPAAPDTTTWSFFRWFWFALWGVLLLVLGWSTHRLTRVRPAPLPEN
ncbi:DUF1523 family protein [Chitinilyticum piscinae]|uniref:DUF1523 family protein n=1 Tax=Chitinilyticum piscinae TaxID=2866724 RepID=A0A8J7FHL5_9NEIS|nr:DUF1523 family protein [Chitinilyticum piscinae]MBE9608355.1 DUF1523 family protein [Chitinilyticum piscinae]